MAEKPCKVWYEADGSTHVMPRTALSDVLFNDHSILANEPIEIQVKPDGWGMVCVQKQIVAVGIGPGKFQVDGQDRNYTYWGWIDIVLAPGCSG